MKTIRYNHRSSETATSHRAALRAVRTEARVRRLATVTVQDGTYCYLSREDRDRDGDGSRAFAVISEDSEE